MVIGLAGFLLSQDTSSSSMTCRQEGAMATTGTCISNVKQRANAAEDKHTDRGAARCANNSRAASF